MELRQLAYFVAVAEERHFTRAALRVHVAQPAVSQQVLRLERELGEQLLRRTPTGAHLTEAGLRFLPHARAALAAAQAGVDELASLRGLLTGTLSVGTVLPVPEGLTTLLGSYREQHPGVELRLREDHTRSLLASLTRGELDVALVGLGPRQRTPDGIDSELVSTEPVVAVMSRTHRFAGRRSIALTQLRDEAMVTLPSQSGQREMLEAAAHAAGFAPRITAESGDVRLLVDLAANGVGIALVPRSAAEPTKQLAVIPISRPRLTRRVVLTWQAQMLSPAAQAFLERAREQLVGRSAQLAE